MHDAICIQLVVLLSGYVVKLALAAKWISINSLSLFTAYPIHMKSKIPLVSTKCWFALAEISMVFQKHPTLPSLPLILLTSILAIPVSTLTSILGRLNVRQPGSKSFYQQRFHISFSTCDNNFKKICSCGNTRSLWKLGE